MFGLSMGELLLVLAVGLLLFGNQLPHIARSLGKGLAEVRQEVRNVKEDASLT